MKEQYEKPEIEVVELDVQDVIYTSGGEEITTGDNETPIIH